MKTTVLQQCQDEADFRIEFRQALSEITKNAGIVLFDKACRVFESLTPEERQKFSLDGCQPVRLAKTIMVACADEIEWQFSAEAIKPAVRAIKRIRKSRYC